jgi:hypothetical protein
VYRKGYGDHPIYGAGAAPAPPATPTAAEAAGWALTAVHASGSADQPPTRDYWYYVLFLTDAGENISAVSNRTNGTLDYVLGDVTNGTTACAGDNLVSTADVSLLGAHYGMTVSGGSDPYACLDVGPTTDHTPSARPTPDGVVEFEDLVLFALNYTGPGGPGPVASLVPAAGEDALELQAPALPDVGESFVVTVRASGRGDVQALRVELGYDRSVVEMTGVEAGELLGRQTAQAVALTPRPGRVDVALLGKGAGLAGIGELVRVHFRVRAAGAPAFALTSADARDGANRPVDMAGSPPPPPALPVLTQLARAMPNPFTHEVSIAFGLAARGPAELAIYAVDGRRVRTLARGELAPGAYTRTWDGRDERGAAVAAGVYYARLVTAHGRFTRMVTYLK